MVTFPNIKINLGLQVIFKRPDGYHNISSCFYPVNWYDVLEAIPAEEFTFDLSGSDLQIPAEKNLCVKAYRLLQANYTLPPVQLILLKVLPDGAGLGGGSSDAAFTLKLLNEQFELGISPKKLCELAAEIGSDCPFFINNQPALVSGRGEIIEPFDFSLKGWHIQVVFPGVKVSTPQAFSGIVPKEPDYHIREVLKLPVSAWKEKLCNDFETTVFPQFPVIGETKEKLYESGAVYASMSGSGSAVFGLFEKETEISWPANFKVYKGIM